MSLTLLLDLDDTLLDTNIEQFIPAYFQALSKHLASQVLPDVMLPALGAGTRRMMFTQDPRRTLREVFDDEFYPKLGLPADGLHTLIEQFYDDVFPTLNAVTRPRPDAVPLVRDALARGDRVSIATDPLFPLKAIHHRLRFAGLPPDEYPFELISSYETFHFTKTHAAYFAEFMGRLGWPEGPVLMVGNDADRDLAPARVLGLPTYWVTSDTPQASDPPAHGRGSLADLRRWLESVDGATLQPTYGGRNPHSAILTATPAVLAHQIERPAAAEWGIRPRPDEWSLTEILCHLRDTEIEVNLPRLERLLAEDDPFIAARDTDIWAEERNYRAQDGAAAFRDFVAVRMELLQKLAGLGDTEWGRRARHSIFGPTTLEECVGFIAQHDRLHLHQVWKLLDPAGPS
jgi:FMN phosphatase YigB (HAD superfamily)